MVTTRAWRDDIGDGRRGDGRMWRWTHLVDGDGTMWFLEPFEIPVG